MAVLIWTKWGPQWIQNQGCILIHYRFSLLDYKGFKTTSSPVVLPPKDSHWICTVIPFLGSLFLTAILCWASQHPPSLSNVYCAQESSIYTTTFTSIVPSLPFTSWVIINAFSQKSHSWKSHSWKMKERMPKIFCWLRATWSKHLCRSGRRVEMEAEVSDQGPSVWAIRTSKASARSVKHASGWLYKKTSVPGIPSGKTRADGCIEHCVGKSLCRVLCKVSWRDWEITKSLYSKA